MKILASLMIILSLISCSYRPILNPNEQYLKAGKEKADKDIDRCTKEAKEYLKQFKARRAAKETVRKGAIGTGIGAITGAITGGNMRSTMGGGLIGLGVGAVVGAAGVIGEDKIKPDQMKQRYVAECLGKDGYSVIGWE